jgi:hypothetical protein
VPQETGERLGVEQQWTGNEQRQQKGQVYRYEEEEMEKLGWLGQLHFLELL